MNGVHNLDAWPYQDEKWLVAPYREQNFPEAFLVECFAKLRAQRSLDLAFAEGGNISLNSFIVRMTRSQLWVGMEKPVMEPALLAWLWEVTGADGQKRASMGFAAFARYWGNRRLYDLADLVLDCWFREVGIERLVGTILAGNRPSFRFAERVGFTRCGVLPGFFDGRDAEVVMLAKHDFSARREHGTERNRKLTDESGEPGIRLRPGVPGNCVSGLPGR